ncbi:alpha/beta hydrolase family protein [Nocardia sp. NPDC057668]|uniref:alpha/beta hydrolase family protein n=1 Tax=Nocardia sp. NPDC057668 TaxID=3346202 RepID=UPI00366DD5C8
MRTANTTRAVRLAAAATAAALMFPAGPAAAEPVEPGFYAPAADLVAGEHGTVIQARSITGDPAVAGARNHLVLYRSVNMQGQPVAVSGTVAVPEGTPPPGGWPLISWAHGTTGVADVCAPSRDTGPDFPAHAYTALVRDTQARLIAAGYAVAQTDYQGLGTAGEHGYLIGDTEMRAVADMALAARAVAPEIGTRWASVGHSQGGQAAIYTAARAQGWAPGLELLGAVAEAPASHQGLIALAGPLAGTTGASPLPQVSNAFLPLMIRGAQTVAEVDPARFLAPEGLELLPQADTRCIDGLREPDSWAGRPLSALFRAGADTTALGAVLNDNDASNLTYTVPVLVVQGTGDTVVPPAGTDAMVAQQRLTGQPVEYRDYPGVDHRGILAAANDDVVAWLDSRFSR